MMNFYSVIVGFTHIGLFAAAAASEMAPRRVLGAHVNGNLYQGIFTVEGRPCQPLVGLNALCSAITSRALTADMDDSMIYWEHVVIYRHALRGSASHPQIPDDVCETARLFDGYSKRRTERWFPNRNGTSVLTSYDTPLYVPTRRQLYEAHSAGPPANASAELVALRFNAHRMRDGRLRYENKECFLWEDWQSQGIKYVTGKRQSADEREEDLAKRILNVHPVQLSCRPSDPTQGTPSYNYLAVGSIKEIERIRALGTPDAEGNIVVTDDPFSPDQGMKKREKTTVEASAEGWI